MRGVVFRRVESLGRHRLAGLPICQARTFASSLAQKSQEHGLVTEKESSILGMIQRANSKMESQGIDPSPRVTDKESLFVKIPGSYRTRLASPLAPGLPSHLSTPLDENGLKFGAPEVVGDDLSFKRLGETVIDQAAKLIMKDGKLSVAMKNMHYVLNHLRQSVPPKYKPDFLLLLEQPPVALLPLDPVRYFTLAVDSVAPVLRIKSVKGAGGGGQSLQLPVSMNLRQRRRMALKWIIAAADKRPNRISGKRTFAHRLGEEIIAIIEGRSGIWEKRNLVHRDAVMSRANMSSMKLKKRGRMMR